MQRLRGKDYTTRLPNIASMNSQMTRAWVEVDLGALLQNGAAIAAHAGVPLLPMVKADAYGVGAVAVARALEELEPWGYGVATVREGEELRRSGITRNIVVFTPLLVGDLDAAQRARLTPVLDNPGNIARWSSTGLPWHLGIDTGMSREGVQWRSVRDVAELVRRFPPQGACTHFHSAELEDGSRQEQERRFDAALDTLGIRPEMLHAENSAGVEHGGRSRWSVVRPGVFLYGVGSHGALTPEPVITVRARVVDMREIEPGDSVSYDATFVSDKPRRVATLSLGYADGYRRALSNRGIALLHGKRAPVLGLVTMDMTMIDVTDIPCAIGDLATVIGRDGDEMLTVSDVAALGELSPYELLTGLRSRLPRRYLGRGE